MVNKYSGSPRRDYGHLLLDSRYLLYSLQMGWRAGSWNIHTYKIHIIPIYNTRCIHISYLIYTLALYHQKEDFKS